MCSLEELEVCIISTMLHLCVRVCGGKPVRDYVFEVGISGGTLIPDEAR